MSGTTPTPGSEPGDENNPYAQPDNTQTPQQPWAAGPPSADQPPAWSGPASDPNTTERPTPPATILNAVKLMYVGAALSVLGMLFTFASRDAVRDALEEGDSDLTASELDSAVNFFVGFGVAVSLIAVALWLWMASANKKGKSWARVLATVLGGLNIVFTLISLFGSGAGGLGVVVNLISIALAAVILWLLYRPESGQYYTAVTRMTR